ncbi:cilia- and flagella-associated protein 57 isoform X2 [Eupeodes corollae]|uniref:cilia- and flagella-associated protein 57 isoform X2 n=1 Tax=Eupeodes corollae TaxID=290404 RepID=UPI0024910F0A|nr:cilia- and flagella-associated protein 57 isoform X2 [Eupeodes corollae]
MRCSNIAIYDTATLKKRRNFQLPGDAKNKKISKVVFGYDSRSIIVLTKFPNQTLYMMCFDKTGKISESVIGPPNQRATATCIAGNPEDTGMVAVCGDGIVKLMSKSETCFTTTSTVKAHFSVKSLAWLSIESLLLGLNGNKLILIENAEVKLHLNASELEKLDLSADPELVTEDVHLERPSTYRRRRKSSIDVEPHEAVMCMIALSKSLAYVIEDKVFFFEKVSKVEYKRIAIIRLDKKLYSEDLFRIKNMTVNAQQDTVIVTAGHSQIYECSLKNIKSGETGSLQVFKPLGEFIHIDEIVDISICSWRTIIMTASKDQTIRIWNYETEKVELVKQFYVDISVAELNATGLFAAIGFTDQLKIMQIFMDDLNIMKEYDIPRCSQVKYSHFGHLMAASFGILISITSVYNLDIIRTLKGHCGNVLSLAWSRDDKYLISGGDEGAIYQWDIETGERIQEIVQKGTEYRALCCTEDPFSILALTGSGFLREFINSEIARELSTPERTPFLSLALARSDLIMFASTDSGHLYNVQLPFLDAGGGTFTNYRFFDSPVTKVVFSYDGTLLITASKVGTLVIWYLQNIDGKVAPLDQDLLKGQEVIIPISSLKRTNEQIAHLELRIIQQVEEFKRQQRLNEMCGSQQLADVHKQYNYILEILKDHGNMLEDNHINTINKIVLLIDDMKADHQTQVQTLTDQFTERMLIDREKYKTFTTNSEQLRDDYENKLKKSADKLQVTIDALEIDCKRQLAMCDKVTREVTQALKNKNFQFNGYCETVASENERNKADNVNKYEQILKTEQEEEIIWRGKAGVLKQKAITVSKEAERLMGEVKLLDEELTKSKKIIDKLQREIENLLLDLSDCDFVIKVKERQISVVLSKNQEIEKHMQVLLYKITELNNQIEPRERQIYLKRKEASEKDFELNSLNNTNVQLVEQLKKLEENYRENLDNMKKKRQAAKSARQLFFTLCTKLYHIAGKVDEPDEVRDDIRELAEKYTTNEYLQWRIKWDTDAKAEFVRQRAYLENSIKTSRQKLRDKHKTQESIDVLEKNNKLLNEIEDWQKANADNEREKEDLINALKLTNRDSSYTQRQLTMTLEEIENCRIENQDEIDTLMSKLKDLKLTNDELHRELKEINNHAKV